jgi:ribose 1,5-bisphosphokinase PhnN
MDERGPVTDDVYRLSQRHVEAGFPLPEYVEKRLHWAMTDHAKRSKAGGAFESYSDYAVNCIRYELLKVVATRLKKRQRESAHRLLDAWDRANNWTGRQFDSVERILSTAVNDCA